VRRCEKVKFATVNFVDPTGLDISLPLPFLGGPGGIGPPPSWVDVPIPNDNALLGGGPGGHGREVADELLPLSQGDIDQLRTDVTNLLKDDVCAKFMSALFNQLSIDTGKKAYSSNPMDIFNAVEHQGSFSRVQGPFSATGGSTVGNGNAAIHVNFYISSNPTGNAMNGRTILHELVHVGSGANRNYDHYEMARAAYAVAQAQGFKGLGGKPPDGDHLKLDRKSSDTFGDILFQSVPRKVRSKCKPTYL
jgi:hypothetical protein